MTLHVLYDHQCPQCEAWYIPYDQGVTCPRCGLLEEQRFDFIRHAAASAAINLADSGSYQPKAWAISCHADHILWLLFAILEQHRNSPQRPYTEVAREAVEQLDWGDQPYGKEHLYEMALRAHDELERLSVQRKKTWGGTLVRWLRRFRQTHQ